MTAAEIYQNLKNWLTKWVRVPQLVTRGVAPNLKIKRRSNIDIIMEAISKLDIKQVSKSLLQFDVAASELINDAGKYVLKVKI